MCAYNMILLHLYLFTEYVYDNYLYIMVVCIDTCVKITGDRCGLCITACRDVSVHTDPFYSVVVCIRYAAFQTPLRQLRSTRSQLVSQFI
jgi:hypothetical protein